MKTSDLVMIGAVAVGGYYAYTKGLFSGLFGTSTPATAAPTGGQQVFNAAGQLVNLPAQFTTPSQVITNANPITNPAAAAAASTYTLGDLYHALQNYTAEVGQWLYAPQWNSALAAVSNIVPPDPELVWPGNSQVQMRLETYWQGMAPWLSAHLGLNGLKGLQGWYA